MNIYKNCPNCNRDIKSSLMSKVELLNDKKIGIINLYNEAKKEGYCTKCGEDLFKDANDKWLKERMTLFNKIKSLMYVIPAISIHSPLNWDYEVIDVVTGQSTMGTGFFTEWSAGWADIWGKQSRLQNDKIKKGEKSSFDQIKKQTLDLEGNAILATDIDYAEVGGVKAMIMVCVTGTAVRLKNFDILGSDRLIQFEELKQSHARMVEISKFK